MFFKKILFFVLILGCIPTYAKNNSKCTKPTVTVSLEKRMPTYTRLPHTELVKICESQNILGCTKASYTCQPQIRQNEKGCKQLNFNCYPQQFRVYLLNDYPEGSCEYKAIRKHENLHVSAIQNFPPKFIEDHLKKCIDKEIKNKTIKNGEQIYMKCAQNTYEWMNQEKTKKNEEIDAYKKYHPFHILKCSNWKVSPQDIKETLDRLYD